jgi:hypothetical protein
VSSNFFEQHHRTTKKAYARTSKRTNTQDAELTHQVRVMSLAAAAMQDEEKLRRTYKTMYTSASLTAQTTAPKSGQRVVWRRWAPDQPALGAEQATRRVFLTTASKLEEQPELARFPAELQHWWGTAGNNLGLNTLPDQIKVVTQAVHAADVEWMPTCALQPLHASANAWGRGAWFDCVSVDAGGGQIWYAQIRLLFEVNATLLVFVRWFDQIMPSADDVLATQHGCVPLVWEQCVVGRGRGPRYGIIGARSIKAREYIVPHFPRGKDADGQYTHFHVSPFKWDRPPADISGFITDIA